jgi:hypothetical protein
MSCLIVTREIRELTNKFPGETEESIKTLVGIWQEENNKSIDEYPTAQELNALRNNLRNSEQETAEESQEKRAFNTPIVSSIEEQAKADLDFDPRVRRDRVSLIARFFSKEIDKSLDAHKQYLQRNLDEAVSDSGRDNIRRQISNLDRIFIIDKFKPVGLFERVKQIFQDYINDSEENRIAAELAAINAKDKLGKFSPEEKYAAAKRRADKKFREYSKIVDNFMVLAEEASTILMTTEHVRIDPNYQKTKEVNTNEDDPNGESSIDENNAMSNEETVKDGWMTNYKHVSSHESLSQAVRAVINQVPRLDYKGKVEAGEMKSEFKTDYSTLALRILANAGYLYRGNPINQNMSLNLPFGC